MNVLIVDDSRFLRLMNERALVKAGFDVLSAADGEEGLRLAIEHKPDLVVLDMMLPKLSGPDVLRVLRKDPGNCLDPGHGPDQPPAVQRTKARQRRSNFVIWENLGSIWTKDPGSSWMLYKKCSPKPKRPAAETSPAENITESFSAGTHPEFV